jgi:hypothetical protein
MDRFLPGINSVCGGFRRDTVKHQSAKKYKRIVIYPMAKGRRFTD